MRALRGGATANLEVAPNLWAGVGLVRGGAGTALVGSHSEVADRIAEYHALGIDVDPSLRFRRGGRPGDGALRRSHTMSVSGVREPRGLPPPRQGSGPARLV
jgi:hypothetical protein